MQTKSLTCLFLTVALVSACSEASVPTELTRSQAAVHPAVSGRTSLTAIDRFSIGIDAEGSFRPGTPIQIRASVTSNTPTPNADITITLPELEMARTFGWGSGFHYNVGTRVQPAVNRSASMARAERIHEVLTVQFEAEGLYRVVVRADAGPHAALEINGRWLQNTAVVERWLLITNTGGKLLESADDAGVPTELRSIPGPRRDRTRARSELPPQEELPSRRGPSVDEGSMLSTITYQVLYWDSDAGSYLPIPDAYVTIRACTKTFSQIICDDWDFNEVDTGYTNSSGYFTFFCQGDEYEGDASTFTGGGMRVNGGVGQIPRGDTPSDCGQSYTTIVQSNAAKVFINSMKARAGASTLFGVNRSWIEINVSSTETVSFYDRGDDEITIATNSVWGAWGIFTAAHEYGHAYHHDALYGIEAMGDCPNGPHYLDTESGLGCAYSEGFADYFGASVRGDLGTYYYRNYMENNSAFPGCVSRNQNHECTGGVSNEGSLIEGAFAAMLYDLTDTAVETHDSIAAPGSYVRDLVRSCTVQYGSATPRRANGTDDIAYCAENSINPGSYFTERGLTPNWFSESATEGGGWTGAKVHSNWTFNMYEKS